MRDSAWADWRGNNGPSRTRGLSLVSKSLLTAGVASWSLTSLGGAMVHVPILVLLSPLVWCAALITFGLLFRFLPSSGGSRRAEKVASVVTFFLGAAAIVTASIFSGSVVGDAINACTKGSARPARHRRQHRSRGRSHDSGECHLCSRRLAADSMAAFKDLRSGRDIRIGWWELLLS